MILLFGTSSPMGTVMIDLESHRIIDMISSRETADIGRWLTTFPNIQVVSRDGASTYPIGQIAAMMHHIYKTIQNYLNPDYRVTDGHYNARIPGKLAPMRRCHRTPEPGAHLSSDP